MIQISDHQYIALDLSPCIVRFRYIRVNCSDIVPTSSMFVSHPCCIIFKFSNLLPIQCITEFRITNERISFFIKEEKYISVCP